MSMIINKTVYPTNSGTVKNSTEPKDVEFTLNDAVSLSVVIVIFYLMFKVVGLLCKRK